MSLKSILSNIGSKIKSAVVTVTSKVQNVASKVIETVKDKSSSIVQTISSVATGNIAGVVSGVAGIFSPTNNKNSSTQSTVKVEEVKNETKKKSVWKTDYNKFTNMLRG